MVVLAAVPVTLALTLFIYFIYGYTLNRVTLFALIFSIGILVDDAIVVVENITRHFHLPENKGRPLADVAVEAVDEVGNPTTLATWTVIAAILPMAFVGGLMGPYMRPIPVGASLAMLFSLFIAFVISPWAALRMLGERQGGPRRRRGRPGGLDHPPLPAADDAPALDARKRAHLPGGRGASAALRVHAAAAEDRARQDAALRQQERVPGDRRHAGGDHAGADRARDARGGPARGPGAGGGQLPGLRGHRRPLQLQRAGAPLLPAARRRTRRTSR